MFLLPSIVLGLGFALVLGGKPSRLAELPIRASWAVLVAVGLQILAFSRIGAVLPDQAVRPLHLASYGFLIFFALANRRLLALAPVLVGMALNALAIGLNGGRMPISADAAEAAGVVTGTVTNVDPSATHLRFLGDVFALPDQLPYANTFSVGDLLIGFGMVAFIVIASLESNVTFSPSRFVEPLRNSGYRRLAAGRLISHLGDWLTLAALVGWMYAETASTTDVAAVLLVRLAPPILGGGIAAVVVDRLSKQRLLAWVEVARGLAVAGALFGVTHHQLPIVFAALGLSSCLGAMSNAAVPALVPSLLPASQLPAANAALGMAKDAAMALGAVTAGITLSVQGISAALIADVVTFAAAAALFSGLPQAVARSRDTRDERESLGRSLGYLFRRRRLLILTLSFCAATLATGLTNATLPRLLEDELGLSSGGYAFGIAALATGLALGGATVGFVRVGPNAGRWIGAGLVMMAGLLALLGLADHVPTALLLIALVGFVDGTTDILFETSLQREADPRHYGSVFGLASSFMTTTMIVAVAVAPLANRLVSARGAIVGASLFLIVAGAIALVGMRHGGTVDAAAADGEAPAEPQVAWTTTNGHARPVFVTAHRIARANGPAPRRWAPPRPQAAPLPPRTEPIVLRSGEDISVIVWGAPCRAAENAARVLERERISLEIVDLTDVERGQVAAVLESVAKTSRALVLHENSGNELRAAEIAAAIADQAFEHLDAPVKRVDVDRDDVVAELRGLAAF